VTVGLLVAQRSTAQSKAQSLQGVWRITEATITGPAARTISFADRPNLTIITAKHYSRVEIQADGPRPILVDVAKATADELRAVWGPVVNEAGTYDVTPDDLVTMRPIASKNPAVMGPRVFITYSYKLDGDKLSLTQQRNQNGPVHGEFQNAEEIGDSPWTATRQRRIASSDPIRRGPQDQWFNTNEIVDRHNRARDRQLGLSVAQEERQIA
jgi:hypothetical protein